MTGRGGTLVPKKEKNWSQQSEFLCRRAACQRAPPQEARKRWKQKAAGKIERELASEPVLRPSRPMFEAMSMASLEVLLNRNASADRSL